MIVIDSQYGKFHEINHLNKNFVPDTNKMRLTIDAVSSEEIYKQAYPVISKQFSALFPRLKEHSCCHSKMDQFEDKRFEQKNIIKTKNYVIDIIHIIEHVIIDLQCSLSGMKICSGITCNFKEPNNRYDIFVECIDENVGFYAAQLAIDMAQRILSNNQLSVSSSNLVSVSDFFHHQAKVEFKLATHSNEGILPYDMSKFLINRMIDFKVKVN